MTFQGKGRGFFPNAQHFSVVNPTMIEGSVHVLGGSNRPFDLLEEHTIPGAEFDSYERDPPPRCHPGTRLDILESIQPWSHDIEHQHRILWLHGPAGVGKSAIMQTLAEGQSESLDTILGATVFFSRPNKRDDPRRLFTTIAYQLAVRYPSYRKYVVDALTNDPKIVGKSIAEQFRWFLMRPFTVAGLLEGLPQTVLIIIDGLDECKGEEAQREIVLLIGRFVLRHPNTPLIWAIASRPEPHLRSVFSDSQIRNCHWEINIPVNSNQSTADVERFLREKFQEIRLRYSSFFPATLRQWPMEAEFLIIMKAASGLFIFASVVIRFIADESYGNPVSQLRKVLTVIETARLQGLESSPFKTLDNMYAEIISAIPPDVLPHTMQLLALSFYSPLELGVFTNYSFGIICNWLGFSQADVYGALHRLHSVLEIPPSEKMTSEHRLRAFHASFPDYVALLLARSHNEIDPRQEILRRSMRVLLESHNPLDSTINALGIGLSWVYEDTTHIQKLLFWLSFISLAPHALETTSWGDGSSSLQLRSLFENINYGSSFPGPADGPQHVLCYMGTGRYKFLSALETWGIAKPFDLQSFDVNHIRPSRNAWILPIAPLSEQTSSSVPLFLQWGRFKRALEHMFWDTVPLSEHPGWKDLVREHVAAINALEDPASVYLVNEQGLWDEVAQRMGLGIDELDSFSPSAAQAQRPFSASNKVEQLQAQASTASSSSSPSSSLPLSPVPQPQDTTTPSTAPSSSLSLGSSSFTASSSISSSLSSIAQHLSRVYKLYLTFFDQAIKENIAQNRAKAQAAMQQSRAQAAAARAAGQPQQQQQAQQPLASTSSATTSNNFPTNPPPPIHFQPQLPLQTRTEALTAQQEAIQTRAQAKAQAAAAHAQAQAAAAAQAHTTHTLIPHGIPLTQFLTQYVGLLPPYVDTLTAQERFMLLEWTQLSDAELKVKTKGKEGMIGIVKMVRETLNEMREGQSSGVRERPGFTTSVAVGIVLPGMKPGPPSAPPPKGPVPPLPDGGGGGSGKGKAKAKALPQGEAEDEENEEVWDDETRQAVIPATKFISSGLKGEPLPPPEPRMGSKASFEVVYRLIGECKITEMSLDNTMDSIIVPAERLPEHHALLDKVSQACSEIDTKLAMIHDVLQEETYIKRMIIIASQVVYQKTLLTKADWERRYVLTVDMLKSMLAEIQYLVGLYNQSIRSLMEAFQSTASAHGHDAAVQQLPSWVQVQLQQQAAAAAAQPQQPVQYTPQDLAAMTPEQRAQARSMQRAQEADLEMRKFREGFKKEGPEEVIRWVENRCRPLKSVYEEYLEQRRVLEERLREKEKEVEEEEEDDRRYNAWGRRRWSLKDEEGSDGDGDGEDGMGDGESDFDGSIASVRDDRRERGSREGLSLFTGKARLPIAKSEWSAEGGLGLPFTEEEHAAAVLFVQCATQEFGSLPATAQMLSWDTDLTPDEKKEYHRLHDKGYRQYQEYGPKTALLHLLMGQDSTTKRFIVIGYVLSYQQHVFATGTKRYILTLDQLEEWVEDYADIIEEFIERKNSMHREQVEAHMRSMGRILDLSGVDIGVLTGKRSRNKNGKKKKKEVLGDTEEEAKMLSVLGGVVDFLEMYRARM
ncbi:hypothetical protein D9756_004609 [Leucocoprinus leucothites]|uniref:NACHT domain-containing protein n=1 Tax=Leucocoprinus leucothites TaxID=201217 RepID=A0A8H5G917_9AGAR|nr:hypothetical protein D9756_004609 [Leucoagaricus leucothites]